MVPLSIIRKFNWHRSSWMWLKICSSRRNRKIRIIGRLNQSKPIIGPVVLSAQSKMYSVKIPMDCTLLLIDLFSLAICLGGILSTLNDKISGVLWLAMQEVVNNGLGAISVSLLCID